MYVPDSCTHCIARSSKNRERVVETNATSTHHNTRAGHGASAILSAFLLLDSTRKRGLRSVAGATDKASSAPEAAAQEHLPPRHLSWRAFHRRQGGLLHHLQELHLDYHRVAYHLRHQEPRLRRIPKPKNSNRRSRNGCDSRGNDLARSAGGVSSRHKRLTCLRSICERLSRTLETCRRRSSVQTRGVIWEL